jgi:hypothetical protein
MVVRTTACNGLVTPATIVHHNTVCMPRIKIEQQNIFFSWRGGVGIDNLVIY